MIFISSFDWQWRSEIVLIVLIVFKTEATGGFKVDIKMYNIDGKIWKKIFLIYDIVMQSSL